MATPHRPLGGLIHTYQGYDPKRFPSPTADPPDMAGAAMNQMMMFGEGSELTEEQLRDAVKIDPSQIGGLGPSIDALIAMLEERKRKILETYETDAAWKEADRNWKTAAGEATPPNEMRDDWRGVVQREQILELERVWELAERSERRQRGERGRDAEDGGGRFSVEVLRAAERLGERYEIEQLESKYAFTGREPMGVDQALEIKETLEQIDRLLEQLREARENAQVGVIDLDELREFVEEADVEQMKQFGEQVEQYMREQAEMQGLERQGDGTYRLTPKAHRIFQNTLLDEIFSELDAARTGRHDGPTGEGAIELPKTRGYEFGDSPTHLDLPQTVTNAAIRSAGAGERGVRVRGEDIDVHLTRNQPKCATSLVVDMSGSMRHMGQYVHCKRMAIAMDGLIRSEYPGDYLSCIEMATFAKPKRPGELPGLMPRPVTIRDPMVRLRVDMSDPEVSEAMVHPHFTNIQHGLRMARQQLAAQDTPNRQIFLITDGLPTAHFEGEMLYLLYPPDPLTEEATMREAMACVRDGITINFFLLPSWSQSSEDIAFAHRIAEQTGGRVIFTGGGDLDRFVLWDYVSHRRRIIG